VAYDDKNVFDNVRVAFEDKNVFDF